MWHVVVGDVNTEELCDVRLERCPVVSTRALPGCIAQEFAVRFKRRSVDVHACLTEARETEGWGVEPNGSTVTFDLILSNALARYDVRVIEIAARFHVPSLPSSG